MPDFVNISVIFSCFFYKNSLKLVKYVPFTYADFSGFQIKKLHANAQIDRPRITKNEDKYEPDEVLSQPIKVGPMEAATIKLQVAQA